MDANIHRILYDWGVPPHIKGFDALAHAIDIVSKDKKALTQVTKVLYPAIAKAVGSTASRVERSIRHAVGISLYNMDAYALKANFGRTIGLDGNVTNSHYIAAIVHSYQIKYGGEQHG